MFKNAFERLASKSEEIFQSGSIVKGAVGPNETYCSGYGEPGASGRNYVLGLVLGTGLAKFNLRHDGSQLLDEINAFDRAEVAETNLGQINMTIVSSFLSYNSVLHT